MSKNPSKNHFIKDLQEMGTQGKNLAKKTQEMGTNLKRLPWTKLPLIGWFYLILILAIIIIFGVFVAPSITVF